MFTLFAHMGHDHTKDMVSSVGIDHCMSIIVSAAIVIFVLAAVIVYLLSAWQPRTSAKKTTESPKKKTSKR